MSNSHKGLTRFETSSWSDFVTYKLENGTGHGHITPYSLAKNYLEISATNLFRTRLGIDHVNMSRPEWSNLVFFMRYQEITLKPEFYELLNCPRSMGNDDYTPVSLSIESGLSYVGKSSFVIVQTLTVNGQYVGEQHMQICCINSQLRKTTQLPDSFLTNPNVVHFRTLKRPNFPHKFGADNLVGSVDRLDFPVGLVKHYPCFRVVFMSDTDENNHLNEAGYIRFIMDACHKLLPNCNKSTHVSCIKGYFNIELSLLTTIQVYTSENFEREMLLQYQFIKMETLLLPKCAKMKRSFLKRR